MFRIKLEKPTSVNSDLIPLTHGKFAVVDLDIDPVIWEYKWRAIKWNFRWYAYSTKRLDGQNVHIAMHRLIAQTPPGEICHHGNGKSLDNRLLNLMNMTNYHHRQLHKIRKFGRKNDNKKCRKL